MSQATSPILDGIRIASPCHADWNAMTGTDQQRFCPECRQDVYNLSALTTAEALELVGGSGPMPCVRFYRRADGTMLTADCPVGAHAVRRREALGTALLGLGVALVSTLALAVGLRRDPTTKAATSSEPAETAVGGIKACFGLIKACYGLPAPELNMFLQMGGSVRSIPATPSAICAPTTPTTTLNLGGGAR